MEKSSIPTVEERGLFKGLGTPPSLNAILLAFVGIVVFLAGAKSIDWLVSKVTPQKYTYERFVWAARDKVVSIIPPAAYPIDKIFIPVTLVRSRTAVESSWINAWEEWTQQETKQLEGKPDVDWKKKTEEFREKLHLPWWIYFVYGFWFIVVWGLFAGAVNRIYAYRIGRDESITIREAMGYGFKTWGTHIFSAVLLAVFVAVIFWAGVLGVWVFGKIPYVSYPGQILLIPGFLLILIASFIIAFIIVILAFAFDLISSAIAVERTDPFDAISRAYAYVTERPWHSLLYTGLATLFVMFFLYFGHLTLGVSKRILATGLGSLYEPIQSYIGGTKFDIAFANTPATLGWLGVAVKWILWVMQIFIFAAAVALWLASRTKSYLLLRQEIDGDDTDEIYIEEEELVEEVSTPAGEEKKEEKKEEEKGEKKEEKKIEEKKEQEKESKGEEEKK
ncbi:MAG: hypothetical protein N2234_09980 [Planctomycetota bacterium]|nr:hypothetical protein [Planctomycetota bacterium]